MANTSNRTDQQQKKSLAEQLWLHYFNSVLYEKELIAEAQRNRISNMINARNTQINPFEKKKKG